MDALKACQHGAAYLALAIAVPVPRARHVAMLCLLIAAAASVVHGVLSEGERTLTTVHTYSAYEGSALEVSAISRQRSRRSRTTRSPTSPQPTISSTGRLKRAERSLTRPSWGKWDVQAKSPVQSNENASPRSPLPCPSPSPFNPAAALSRSTATNRS